MILQFFLNAHNFFSLCEHHGETVKTFENLWKVKTPRKKRSLMPFKLKFTIRGLVSQEVNFKACWQYTNEMPSILVSLKVVMSLDSMHACRLYSLELKREIQL